MSFNEFINNRRKELGLSVDELVSISGIPKGTLSKITAGINTNPTLSTVESLCTALKCSLNDAVGCYADQEKISQDEIHLLSKYHSLDEFGKKAVDSILNIEYERCSENRRITNIKNSEMAVARSSTRNFMPVPTDEQLAMMDEVTPDMLGE